jgi:hypothetical protein
VIQPRGSNSSVSYTRFSRGLSEIGEVGCVRPRRAGKWFLVPFLVNVVNIGNKMTTKAVVERLLKAVCAHLITSHGNGGCNEDLDYARIAHTLVYWAE